MANIGGGEPNKLWKGNLMLCTLITHPINMMNGKKKKSTIEPLKKGRSQSTRDSVKSNGNSVIGYPLTLYSNIQSTLCTDFGMSQAEITKNDWTIQPVKSQGHDEAHPRNHAHKIYHFIYLPLFILFQMARKSPGSTK